MKSLRLKNNIAASLWIYFIPEQALLERAAGWAGFQLRQSMDPVWDLSMLQGSSLPMGSGHCSQQGEQVGTRNWTEVAQGAAHPSVPPPTPVALSPLPSPGWCHCQRRCPRPGKEAESCREGEGAAPATLGILRDKSRAQRCHPLSPRSDHPTAAP